MPVIKNTLEIDERGFIFDPQTGSSFAINKPALFIMKELKAGLPLRSLQEALQKKYGIDSKIAKMDLADFVRQLTKLELLNPDKVSPLD